MQALILHFVERNIIIKCIFIFSFLLFIETAHAQSISLIRYFDTWGGGGSLDYSTDPAGIGYHAPSGNLYIVDSEINEIGAVFTGANMFEVSLLGDIVYQNITSNNEEPTGITFNEFDGYFYVTNDLGNAGGGPSITRYDINFSVVSQIFTDDDVPNATDPEGITSDPVTGFLYVASGNIGGRQVLVYNSNLEFQNSFSVGAVVNDPEGIAFNPDNNHLYIVDGGANEIYEFTTSGTHIETFDLSGFSPTPISAQGLTFAPTSDTNDDPGNLSLYIADGMIDNNQNSNERDGRIFEANISSVAIAGVSVIQTGGSTDVTEDGATDTYDISLDTTPSGNVEITVSADTQTEISTDGNSFFSSLILNFTDQNPQTITVRAIDDAVEEELQHSSTITHSITGTINDPSYPSSLNIADVLATVTDNDGSELIATFQDGVNTYSGTRDTKLSVLSPATNFGTSDFLEVDGDPDKSILLYWDISDIPSQSTIQTVDITVDVSDASSDTYEIYELLQPWVENEATWDEFATGQSWEVGGADGSSDRGTTVLGELDASSTGSFTFSLNASGISVVQSWINSPGSNKGFIFSDYTGATSGADFSSREASNISSRPELTIRYTPPDPGVTITESGGSTDVTEGGTTDSYDINLNTVPTGAVEITVTADSESEVSTDGSNYFSTRVLTFTDQTAQTITVRAVDDAVVESSPHSSTIGHAVTGTVNDANYPTSLSIDDVTANITDNDVAGVTITESGGSTDVTEGGTTDSYDINLNTVPTGAVEITVTADSESEVSTDGSNYFSTRVLTFTDQTAQTITVRAVDDAVVESSPHSSTIGHAVTGTVNDANYPTSLSIDDVTANITDNDFEILVDLKIFLEGPYQTSTNELSSSLSSIGYIPLTAPYTEDPRTVASIPADITDWVLIELRESATGSTVAAKSVFLKNTGKIVADDGLTEQVIFNLPEGSYYIIIRHRNHLSIMSANPVSLNNLNDGIDYDFTSGTSGEQFYGGSSGAIQLNTGIWGMISGDGNNDGGVYGEDYTLYQLNQGNESYHKADFNMDGGVYGEDYTIYQLNQGLESSVPTQTPESLILPTKNIKENKEK